VLASILADGLVAAALSLTVWSYRNALAAHNLARAAVYERSYSRAAETHLARERSVMNESLLNPLDRVQGEIKTNQLGFVSNLSKVGVGEPAPAAEFWPPTRSDRSHQQQRERGRRAFARPAVNPDSAAVSLDDPLRDRESEAGALTVRT